MRKLLTRIAVSVLILGVIGCAGITPSTKPSVLDAVPQDILERITAAVMKHPSPLINKDNGTMEAWYHYHSDEYKLDFIYPVGVVSTLKGITYFIGEFHGRDVGTYGLVYMFTPDLAKKRHCTEFMKGRAYYYNNNFDEEVSAAIDKCARGFLDTINKSKPMITPLNPNKPGASI